jgi:signal transduction histidine kinase
VELGALVTEAVLQAAASYGERNVVVRVAEDVPAIVTDAGKVSQVLLNLLSNAIKYSPQGAPLTVDVSRDASHQRVIVDVTDEGIGIADRDKHRLFASFSRVTRSDEEIVRGAGLGLYISRRLVQALGGEIWIKRSRIGEGSTFSFALPMSRAGDVSQAA